MADVPLSVPLVFLVCFVVASTVDLCTVLPLPLPGAPSLVVDFFTVEEGGIAGRLWTKVVTAIQDFVKSGRACACARCAVHNDLRVLRLVWRKETGYKSVAAWLASRLSDMGVKPENYSIAPEAVAKLPGGILADTDDAVPEGASPPPPVKRSKVEESPGDAADEIPGVAEVTDGASAAAASSVVAPGAQGDSPKLVAPDPFLVQKAISGYPSL